MGYPAVVALVAKPERYTYIHGTYSGKHNIQKDTATSEFPKIRGT